MRAVFARAIRAPSVRNSQPWVWKSDQKSLKLYADLRPHLCRTDPDCRDLLISCGASLHHCTVALASMGWHASVRRLPDPADPTLLAAVTVERRSANELDLALAGAIERRRSDRRQYSSWPVLWGDVALMGARAARSGVMLRQIAEIPRLTTIVADAVSRAAADPNYLEESGDRGGRRAPATEEPADDNRANVNGVVLVLGTESDDPLARLRAGEATSLVLLSATAMGLSTCSITEPLEVAETREEVRADVFGCVGYPQIFIRLGWPPVGADPLPATPRRPLEANALFG